MKPGPVSPHRFARAVACAALGLVLSPVEATATSQFTLQPRPLIDTTSLFREFQAHRPSSGEVGQPPRVRLESWSPEQPHLPRRVGKDLVTVMRAPLVWQPNDWRKLGIAALAVGATGVFDEPIDGWLDANRSRDATRTAKAVRPLGQEGALALLGATWLVGKGLDRPGLVAVSEDSLEAAIIAAGVIAPVLKIATARVRPRFSADASAFGAGGQSFPSGETTMAFAIASVVAAHAENPWVDAAAWSAATLVGLERMTLDAHWASDVVAGALIGTAVGRWVARRNSADRLSPRYFSLRPSVMRDGAGITVSACF